MNSDEMMVDAEDGEVVPSDACPNKVYIRGVDVLSTQDVENFAKAYYPSDDFQKVEWINDESANIIYATEIAAAEALEALSAEPLSDQLESRRAQPFVSKPEAELFVRLATVADVKKRGAAHESRYYLMNPNDDPLYRPQKFRHSRGRPGRSDTDRRDRYGYRNSDYEHGTGGGSLNYDEEPDDNARRPAGDLFSKPEPGRLRDRSRSASPLRQDGDGRYGFSDEVIQRRTARARSRSPFRPRRRSSIISANRRDNREAMQAIADKLFNNRSTKPLQQRELLPDILRSLAKSVDEYSLEARTEPRDLFPRATMTGAGGGGGGGARGSQHGRLNGSQEEGEDGENVVGIKIKGASDKGISFLGASRNNYSAAAKELFPYKQQQQQQSQQQQHQRQQGEKPDLFAGRQTGRGFQRRAAADELF